MIISKTPLRVSFAGGGSDLKAYYQHGHGTVVSTAIDKFVYIAVNKRFSDQIRIGYSKVEWVDRVEQIEHNLVREALKMVNITKGIEIVYMSDMLPAHEGSGLGASSSIIVGTLNALYAFKGIHVSPERLAREACQIEIDILGQPIGKQDQYAAAYGGFNYIQFNADEKVLVEPVVFKKKVKKRLNDKLLMFYTNMNAQSDTILTEQKRKTKDNLYKLDKMVQLARDLRGALRKNSLKNFGKILHKGWFYKKKLASKISNPSIDKYYQKARIAGAMGGKILGSGGGGFLLLYCPKKHQGRVRKALKNLKETSFNFEPQGSRIVYVND